MSRSIIRTMTTIIIVTVTSVTEDVTKWTSTADVEVNSRQKGGPNIRGTVVPAPH